MPEYDSENFDPPAPVAYVTLLHPVTGASVSNIPVLLDTGADVSLLPREFVEQLGVEPVDDVAYEIQWVGLAAHFRPPEVQITTECAGAGLAQVIGFG